MMDEIDRILMGADVEFMPGVPVNMNEAGAKAIRAALAKAGFVIIAAHVSAQQEETLDAPLTKRERDEGYGRLMERLAPGYAERRKALRSK